jgi:Putative metallopeptidase
MKIHFSMPSRWPKAVRHPRLGCALLALIAFGTGPLLAQAAPPAKQTFAQRVAETERELIEHEPALHRFPPHKRKALIEFVIGNLLFVSTHELGHGVLSEFELPNLAHDEDAADNFAILTALRVGDSFSETVLIEATNGWHLADLRDKHTGEKPAYYDEHGMNLQRAYQIICMMVGSHPEKFKELAGRAEMPEDRQASCKGDFTFAEWSWETLLKPHLRASDAPKQKIELTYGEAKGKLGVYARAFREIKFLETLAEHIGERYAWPRPFVMEMVECGEVGANWSSRKLKICYEMAQEFAELYRDYGDKLKISEVSARKKKR